MNNYIDIPANGSPSWKRPVPNAAALPAAGNTIGDARIDTSTDTIYVWTGSAWVAVATPGAAIAIDGLNADVSASGPGVVPATVNFVGGSSAASVNTATVLVNTPQSGNKFLGSPADGSSGAPAFRHLVTADLPSTAGFNFTDSSAGADGVTVTGGVGAVLTATSIAQAQSSASQNGYLSSTDWSTFNSKQNALTFGDLTDAGTDGITVTNGSGAVIGSGTSLSQHVADATHNGYLSSTDWNTFSSASGNAITALTGDGTATGPGSVPFTLTTVNSDVGSFGASGVIPSFTVNAKGLITAAGTNNLFPAPLTFTTLLTPDQGAPGTFIGNDSDLDQAVHNVIFGSTDTAMAGNVTSNVTLSAGDNTNGASTANAGHINLYAGSIDNGSGNAGDINLFAGFGNSGLSGNILLSTSPNLSAAYGLIQLQNGTQGTAGQIWTSTDVNGSGAWMAPATSGTVTSVGLSTPGVLYSVSGSPVTSSGTLALNLIAQTANTVLAGPASAGPSNPSFRALVAADIPFPISGFTQGSVLFADSSGHIAQDNAKIFWDDTNFRLGIGTATPSQTIDVIANTASAADGIQITGYGVNPIGFRGRHANGTLGSPTAAVANDTLVFLNGRGYGSTGFAAAATGSINISANETFTDTSMATYMRFYTTPTTTVTPLERMRIAPTGFVGINQTNPAATLEVDGSSGTTLKIVDGNQGQGKTLVSDSTGQASWQTNNILAVTTKTGNYTITTSDQMILADSSGGIFTLTLPAPTVGFQITIKDSTGSSGTNNITIARHASEKIEGVAASYIMQSNWISKTFFSNGTDWFMS